LTTENFEIQVGEEFAGVVLSGCEIGVHGIPDRAQLLEEIFGDVIDSSMIMQSCELAGEIS